MPIFKQKAYILIDEFGSFLWGRVMAVRLRDTILNDGPEAAIIDFDGIGFITRAFADEFLKVKRFLEEKKIQITLQHVASPVAAMLEHAQKPAITSK